MNKTTEALKLAEEALSFYVEDFDCAADVIALTVIREAKAELEKQEPVAHYKDAPHTIYLQTGCDDPEDCDCSFNEWGDTTWCADQIHDTDIPYIRADYAAPVSAKLEWVDLTDDELKAALEVHQVGLSVRIGRIAIAAFKDKNK